MGGQRRRRELKQHLRAASPTPTMVEIVRGMAALLASDDPERAPVLALALDEMPPLFSATVAAELEGQRAALWARGWTDAALDDIEQSLLWSPPEASSLERDLRLLVLLRSVAPRRSAA